jgi:hypothetical protein
MRDPATRPRIRAGLRGSILPPSALRDAGQRSGLSLPGPPPGGPLAYAHSGDLAIKRHATWGMSLEVSMLREPESKSFMEPHVLLSRFPKNVFSGYSGWCCGWRKRHSGAAGSCCPQFLENRK